MGGSDGGGGSADASNGGGFCGDGGVLAWFIAGCAGGGVAAVVAGVDGGGSTLGACSGGDGSGASADSGGDGTVVVRVVEVARMLPGKGDAGDHGRKRDSDNGLCCGDNYGGGAVIFEVGWWWTGHCSDDDRGFRVGLKFRRIISKEYIKK